MTRPAAIGTLLLLVPGFLYPQEDRYRDRESDCRYTPPEGAPLPIRTSDSGIRVDGYVAQRVMAYAADASGLAGGEVVACSEYGRLEIIDSDDDMVRVQVRWDAFSEGAQDPGAEARRVIAATEVQVHLVAREGRLLVRVWHPRLAFTVPGGQPAWVSLRIQVPNRGAYHVATEAFHGVVSVRRLSLSGATLSGRVGEKLKGIDGFIAGTELYDVTLAGDLEISNPLTELGAPVIARVRVGGSSRITITTGGNIQVAVQPHPQLGVKAFAGGARTARVAIDRGVPGEPADSQYARQAQQESREYTIRPLRVDIHAVSSHGSVDVVSIPSAPIRVSDPPR
jgi:hypothetical protein